MKIEDYDDNEDDDQDDNGDEDCDDDEDDYCGDDGNDDKVPALVQDPSWQQPTPHLSIQHHTPCQAV